MLSEMVLAALFTLTPGDMANRPTGGAFTAVTDQFGALVVRPGRFTAESNIVPWSSWWFPLNDDFIFQPRDGLKSPLERYDMYAQKATGRNPDAAGYERTQLYQPHAVAWAGLCDAWAIASILEPEPRVAVNARGIAFRVADLKALLLKTYEAVDGLKVYGQRYEGKWDSVYEDIYAEQFHRFMQVELFQKHLPFVMDEDAGIEVWNTPVWKAQTILTADLHDPGVIHVKTSLYTASPHVQDFNYVGTEQVVRDYSYDLYGATQADGSFAVKYGVWTDRSRWDHPDDVIEMPTKVQRKSWNQQIDVGVVDAILRGQ